MNAERIATPPREVWSLLDTIAAYQLTVLGIVLWFALPAMTSIRWADALGGIITLAALAVLLWLLVSMLRPARATRRQIGTA